MSATFIKWSDAGCTLVGFGGTAAGDTTYTTGGDRYSNGAGDTASFQFTGLTASTQYLIAFTWFQGGNRATNTQYQILDSNGTTVLSSGTINQQLIPFGTTWTGANARPFLLMGVQAPTSTSLTLKITVPSGGNYSIADAALIQPYTDPAGCATLVDGDWATAGSWSGGIVPRASSTDVAYINNATTITADRAIGDGSNNTFLYVSTNSGGGYINTGNLTITGAKLTLRGSAVIGNYTANTTVYAKLVIQNSGSTPGGIEFDANSGVTPTLTISDNTQLTMTGTLSTHCFIRTKTGSAGNNGQILDNATSRGFYASVSFSDFSFLGSSSTNAIASLHCSDVVTTGTCVFTWDHCTFDHCGHMILGQVGANGTDNTKVTNCVWTNTLGGAATIDNCLNLTMTAALTSGTRLIDHCNFGVGCRPYFNAPLNFTITNNYFGDATNGGPGTGLWSTFDGNFWYTQTEGTEKIACGNMTNNYYYYSGSADVIYMLDSCSGSSSMSNNVFEYGGTGTVTALGTTTNQIADCTYTWSYNICILSSTGTWHETFNCGAAHANIGANICKVFHNTLMHNISTNSFCAVGAGVLKLHSMSQLQANIFYNSNSTPAGYVFEDFNTQGSFTVDGMLPAAATNNCVRNWATVPAGTFTTVAPIVAGAGTCTDNTRYYEPMSGSSPAPGANDLVNVDPQFVNPSANLASWDTAQGGPGTVAHALTLIQANITLVKTSLLPYIRAAFRPKNIALRGASFAGDPSTADAAGNVWPGSGPGMGAMAYFTSSTVSGRRPLLLRTSSRGAS